jgi:chemotaxis protein histidine kinase CheA
MAQTPGAVPEQALQAASKPRPGDDQVGEPESLMAILKRASATDDRAKRERPPKLAAVPPPPPSAAPAPPPARNSARPPVRPSERPEGDPIDAAGHALIALLQSAAEASNEELDRASIMAGRLAGELRATENRLRELEAEVVHYRDRAARAEDWLQQIGQEIQAKLLPPRRGGPG